MLALRMLDAFGYHYAFNYAGIIGRGLPHIKFAYFNLHYLPTYSGYLNESFYN